MDILENIFLQKLKYNQEVNNIYKREEINDIGIDLLVRLYEKNIQVDIDEFSCFISTIKDSFND